MADIRIKDLTTTASTTAADDFFAADGTTNGTRKLSAYSPSFGGNATVGGTLTVSGSGSSTVAGKLVVNPLYTSTQKLEVQIPHVGSTENYLRVASNNGANTYGGEYGYGLTSDGNPEIRINRVHEGTATNVIRIPTTNGNVTISTTTASTTTSSGALVVGNGTSGGLGVGGAINAGSNIGLSSSATNGGLGFSGTNSNAGTAAYSYIDLQNGNGTSYALGLRYHGNGFTQVNAYRANRGLLYGAFDLNFLSGQYKFWFGGAGTGLDNSVAYEGVNIYGPTQSTGIATISFTTPSTNATSGALVVSGGVGVAKELYVGSATDSSTNTTGAVVVTGGLGIGGNLNMGGRLFINNTTAANGSLSASGIVSTFGADGVLGGLGFTVKGFPSATAGSRYIQLAAADTADYREIRINDLGGNVKIGGTNSVLTVSGTTASTGTSSGALVVSGGVGVAKGLYVGEEITAANGTSTAPSIRFSSATTSGFSRVNTNSIGIVNNGIASGYLDGISGSGGLYIAASGTNQGITLAANGTGTVAISGAFQVGNAYTAGAPTATGYIVIKDSTGTSYKIPAVAL